MMVVLRNTAIYMVQFMQQKTLVLYCTRRFPAMAAAAAAATTDSRHLVIMYQYTRRFRCLSSSVIGVHSNVVTAPPPPRSLKQRSTRDDCLAVALGSCSVLVVSTLPLQASKTPRHDIENYFPLPPPYRCRSGSSHRWGFSAR